MRTNPNDPYGKILIVTGGDANDLVDGGPGHRPAH